MGTTIRAGGDSDLPFVQALAETAFGAYGNVPLGTQMWSLSTVNPFVAERSGEPIGLLMLAFYDGLCDLLALAVRPEYEHLGVGRRLLGFALARAREREEVRTVVLSVAETNTRAIRLFECGRFAPMPGDFGRYPSGQRVLRMQRLVR